MANQTQKQKAAKAAAAVKAAEEAKAAAEETAKQEAEAETVGENTQAPEEEAKVETETETVAEKTEDKVEETLDDAVVKVVDPIQLKEDAQAALAEREKQVEQEKPKEPPVLAKSTPKMKRVEIKNDDININTISKEDYFQIKHKYIFGTGSQDLQEVISFLDRYEDEMARGKVVADQFGASLQQQLYRVYLRALMLGPNERSIAMDYVLWKFFKNEKSSFRVTNLARFTRSAKWDIPELLMFNTLNTIFHSISNPTDRVLVIRDYKLGAIVSKFPSDKARYTESFLNWAQTLR